MQQKSDIFQLFSRPLVCEYCILTFCFVLFLHFQGDIQMAKEEIQVLQPASTDLTTDENNGSTG